MRWFISILIVLVLVAGLWWMEQQRQAELRPEPGVDIPAEPAQPEPRYPLPRPEVHPASSPQEEAEDDAEARGEEQPRVEPDPQPPLPDLVDSDAFALETLSGLLGDSFVQQWIKPEFIIPRTVAVINSLDGQAPALKTRPLQTFDTEPGKEEVEDEDPLRWTEWNAERYDTMIDTLQSVSPERAGTLYARYYPLFQQAWNELGETEPHFNDRLIDVIDHMLATPEVELPFELVPYEGQLHFADKSLQEESWGRKLLIRMGRERAGQVKEWLRRFRNAVIGHSDPLQGRPPADH